MKRRSVLGMGLAGVAVLTVAGGGLSLVEPGLRDARLTPAGRAVFAAVADAVLEGVLPVEPAPRATAIDAHLRRLEGTIAALSPPARRELSQLVALLHSPPGRVAMCGLSSAWSRANREDVQRALQVMRASRLNIRQQAYHALRDLTNAAYFAEPSTWAFMGYPGPRALS